MKAVDKRTIAPFLLLGILIRPALAAEEASSGAIAAVIVLVIFALLMNLRPRRIVMHRTRRMAEIRGPEISVAPREIALSAVKKTGRKKRRRRK